MTMTMYRITTQALNADGTPGVITDIVEMESNLRASEASSFRLWKEYERTVRDFVQNEHPQTDEHLAGCAECMMQHDKNLPEEL